jgi:cytochrome c2
MKQITVTALIMAILIITGIIACNSSSSPSSKNEGIVEVKGISTTAINTKENQVERGRYLVTIMGCHDCHSPKKMGPKGPEFDSSRLLSGHPASMPLPEYNQKALKSWVLFNHNLTAFVGPWGVTYSANLTSDESGIGNWTEDQFIKALREGKSKGLDNNRPILPPMPWNVVGQASDDDLKAIFAYLKSTPPVLNIVPAPVPPAEAPKL